MNVPLLRWFAVVLLVMCFFGRSLIRAEAARSPEERRASIEKLTKAIAQNSKDANARCDRGELEMTREDCVKAMEDFDAALALDPSLERAYNSRGLCHYQFRDVFEYFDQKKYEARKDLWQAGHARDERAIGDLRRVNEAHPDRAEGYLNLARMEWSTGDEKMLTHCTKALEIDPKLAGAYGLRGDWYHGQVNGDNETTNRECLRLALADYGKAIELEPRNAAWYFGRAACYKGDYPDREAHAAKVSLPVEDDAKLIAQSLADLEQVIRLDPTFKSKQGWNPYDYRSELHKMQSRFDLALTDFQEKAKVYPEYQPLVEAHAVDLKAEQAYRTKELAEKALADRLAVPLALLAEKKFAEVIVAATKLIVVDSKDVGALAIRGDALFWTKDYVKAVADYESVLRLDPKFGTDEQRVRMLFNVCDYYASTGKSDLALAMVKSVFDALAPEDHVDNLTADTLRSIIYVQRGQALAAEGKEIEAIADFTAAIKADPSNYAPYFARGLAYTRLKPPELGRAKEDLGVSETKCYGRKKDDAAEAQQSWVLGEIRQARAELLEEHNPEVLREALGDYQSAVDYAAKAVADGAELPDFKKMFAEKKPALLQELLPMIEQWTKSGKHGEANSYIPLIEADPDNDVLPLAQAVAYKRDGREQLSAGAILSAIRPPGKHTSVAELMQKAAYLVELEHFQWAISLYDEVLAQKPDEFAAYVFKGQALITWDNFKAAIEALDHVPNDSPLYGAAQYQRKIAVAAKAADEKLVASINARIKAVADEDAAENRKQAASARAQAIAAVKADQNTPHYDICGRCGGNRWIEVTRPASPPMKRVRVLSSGGGGWGMGHDEMVQVNPSSSNAPVKVIDICPVCNGTGWIKY